MDPNQNQPVQYPQNQYPQPGQSPVAGSSDHHKRNTAIIIGLSVLSVILLAIGIWLFSMYSQQKSNVDEIAAERVAAALEAQKDELTQEFTKQRESDTTRFEGPSIYGSLNFAYPKLWSVYDNPDPNNTVLYEVKIHPGAVGRGVSGEAIIARVIDSSYADELAEYDNEIEDGTVKVSAIESNGQKGVRLTGAVGDDDEQSGVKILLPLRDRTISLTSLSQPHRDVFNASVNSLKFQP